MYHKLHKHIESEPPQTKRFLQYAKLGILTIPYWLVQGLPEMSAMKRHLLGQRTTAWEKTEKTEERAFDSALLDKFKGYPVRSTQEVMGT